MTASLTTSSPIRVQARLYYLDSLRVLATLIVFLFHSLHPFDQLGWHIKNDEQSIVLTVVMFFLSTWGMPFFFLLAGAGTWLALQRRTAHQYLSERLRRLMVPFVFGSLLLTPIMKYFEWMHRLAKGEATDNFVGYLATMRPGFTPAMFGMVGYHLWFLGFLFAYSVICLPLFLWLKREAGQAVVRRLAALADLRGGLLLYVVPVWTVLSVLRPFFPGEHDWTDFFYRMCFFILGFVMLADERFPRALRRDWILVLAAGVAAFLAMLGMFVLGILASLLEGPVVPLTFVLAFLVALSSVAWTLVMLYVGMRFMDRASRLVDYGQEAVLPFYALHQPVIIVIAFYVVQWPVPLLLKVVAVVAGSFSATLGLYHFLVRRVTLLRTVFGMTPPRSPAGRAAA